MSSDIAYAVAALICYGLSDAIYKRAASAGLAAQHFLMGQAWIFCPATILYAAMTGTLRLSSAALWGGIAGLFLVVGFYNYARSLQAGSVSIIAPVFRLNFIVTAVLAIGWLHETLTAQKIGGFLLAIGAGWLLLGGSLHRDGVDADAARRSLRQVFVATLATGAANFCYKLGLIGGATPETLLVVQSVVFSFLLTAMTYRMTGAIRLPRGVVRHSGPAALVLIAAFLFLLHGLKHGDASVVVPIAQMGFVVAAVLGVVVFGERWTARKIAGLCTATAALVLLAIG
jgi:drug/metabolite transporter (DMT)-like permease